MINSPLRNISARLAKNSSATLRNPRVSASTAMPTASITGPISLAMNMELDIDHAFLTSRGLRVLSEPGAHPRVGIGILGDIADHGDAVGAGNENLRRLFELDAADRDQRDVADAFLPFADLRNALRREPHRLQCGGKDRAQRDVVGLRAQRSLKLGVVMS